MSTSLSQTIANLDYSVMSSLQLEEMKKMFQKLKSEKQREIDHIDTEIIGIQEQLRKRRDQTLRDRRFQNAFSKE